MHKILFVEDSILYAETLIDFLSDYSFEISHVTNQRDALEKLYKENFDLYLLDINLESSNGIELLSSLRAANDTKPALFLTSDSSSTTAVECFQVGCDDYIRKNCDMDEIAERIKLTLKKCYPQKNSLVALGDGYWYNIEEKIVLQNDLVIELAQKELTLLELLIKKRGSTVLWDEITAELWSPSENISVASVRVYINALKKILGKDAIKNIKGVGYKLSI